MIPNCIHEVGNGKGNPIADGCDTHPCSEEWKKDIEPLDNALKKLLNISGITFKWNKGDQRDSMEDISISAEDLDSRNLPVFVEKDDNGEYQSINIVGLIPVFVEALKELKAENDMLKNELAEIKALLNK